MPLSPAQEKILAHTLEHESVTTKAAMSQIGLSYTVASSALTELVAAKWIISTRRRRDGCTIFVLTPAGRHVIFSRSAVLG